MIQPGRAEGSEYVVGRGWSIRQQILILCNSFSINSKIEISKDMSRYLILVSIAIKRNILLTDQEIHSRIYAPKNFVVIASEESHPGN